MLAELIEISNLREARQLLKQGSKPAGVVNSPEIIAFLGIRGVHYIFENLRKEFSNIKLFIPRVEQQLPGFLTALNLGYRYIIYNGNSLAIIQLAAELNVTLFKSVAQASQILNNKDL